MNIRTTFLHNRFVAFELLLAAIVLLFVATGCNSNKLQAWGGVIANDVENQIDLILGKQRVLREQAVQAIEAAKTDVARLQELAVSSQVDAEMLKEKVAQLRALELESKEQLGQLAEMMENNAPIELENGAVWQPSDIEVYAQTKIVEHKTLTERIAILEESIWVQLETSSQAKAALAIAEQNIASMTASLELLDAKIALLQAIEIQPDVAATGDPAVGRLLGDTDTLIDSLLNEVEREIRIAKGRKDLYKSQAVGVSEIDSLSSVKDTLVDELYSLSGLER